MCPIVGKYLEVKLNCNLLIIKSFNKSKHNTRNLKVLFMRGSLSILN